MKNPCPNCGAPMKPPKPVKPMARVVRNIGSSGDPRKLSLYEREDGVWEWLPDSEVVMVEDQPKS